MILLFSLLFLIGSLPTAFLVGKIAQGKDLRKLGSGNIGATNAFRVLGKKAGFFVFAVDFAKGYLPVLFAKPFFSGQEHWVWLVAAPILGHIFTPFLGFRGGKGIATGAGALLALGSDLFLFSLAVWVLFFLLFRIVSVGSLVSSALLPLWAWFRGQDLNEVFLLSFLAVLFFWTHRSNLQRLFTGKESNFSPRSK